MNRWECQHEGCPNSVIGCGGAIGLRAIGWYYELGPLIFCPNHRPDGTLERGNLHDPDAEDTDKPCSLCQADAEARRIQAEMFELLPV